MKPLLLFCCLFSLYLPMSSYAQDCTDDTTAPSVSCLNGLAYNLAPNAMLTLQAQDLDAGSTDDCSSSAGLSFSFSMDTADSTRTFVCDDLGTIDFELWVTDEAGNQDFCTIFMSLEDVFNACGGGTGVPTVAGCITTDDGVPMERVGICFFVNPLPTPLLDTEIEGCYSVQIPESGNFSGRLTAKRNGDDQNGVTTFDMVLIRKHILNIENLDSPYKIIAADVNKSGSVSTFDIVITRKLLLGNIPEFPTGDSWRFIPRDYEFPNPLNPFVEEFPETIELESGHTESVDFIAIKLGDVNNSATTE